MAGNVSWNFETRWTATRGTTSRDLVLFNDYLRSVLSQLGSFFAKSRVSYVSDNETKGTYNSFASGEYRSTDTRVVTSSASVTPSMENLISRPPVACPYNSSTRVVVACVSHACPLFSRNWIAAFPATTQARHPV